MLRNLLAAILFCTWPIVTPLKVINTKNIKTTGLIYLAGIIAGYAFALLATVFVQWMVFLFVLAVIGILWGHWIAQGIPTEGLGKYVSVFAAGFLLAFPIRFLISHLFVGFIFRF